MCETCNELDKKIEHYERIAFSLNDQLKVDRIKELISKLEAQKKALHRNNSKAASSWRIPPGRVRILPQRS
jgi:hypothetical protein